MGPNSGLPVAKVRTPWAWGQSQDSLWPKSDSQSFLELKTNPEVQRTRTDDMKKDEPVIVKDVCFGSTWALEYQSKERQEHNYIHPDNYQLELKRIKKKKEKR